MNILLVDDSRSMRMIIKQSLSQAGYGGHNIEEAGNGKEALEKIKITQPNLLIVDWNMPEMNGVQLLETVKRMGLKPVFGFITSEGTNSMQQRAQDLGARFFITKPFSLDTFKSALDPILS